MGNSRKNIALASIAVISILAALIFNKTHNSPQRCVFDILMPEEVVEIFFEVKEAVLNNPETKILPYLSSSTKNILRAENVDFRGESFIFINTGARVLYWRTNNMLSFHSPPYQGEDINQRYKYTLLEEALIEFLGEPQMRGKTIRQDAEVSFWGINNGRILLSINRNYRISSIIMTFSSEVREPVLFSFDYD